MKFQMVLHYILYTENYTLMLSLKPILVPMKLSQQMKSKKYL